MTDQRNDSGQGDGVLGDMNGGQSSGLQQDEQGFGDVANDELDGNENAEPGDDVETDDQDAVGGESGAGYGNHGGSSE